MKINFQIFLIFLEILFIVDCRIKKDSLYLNSTYAHKTLLNKDYGLNSKVTILEEQNEINLIIKEKNNNNTINIGANPILYFITDYNDNEANIFNISDIKEKTIFNTTIMDNNKINYDANCRLWKPINENIIIICYLNDTFKIGEQKITFNKAQFLYSNTNIIIYSETSIKINQYQYDIPFIYSDKQIINIQENKESYELKFNYENYNNDILFVKGKEENYITLDNCRTNNEQIICTISKKKIEEKLIFRDEIFILGTMNDDIGLLFFNLCNNTYINHQITDKENIDINITSLKLIEENTDLGGLIAYETVIDYTSNVLTNKFNLKFGEYREESCFFKKSKYDKHLLLICSISNIGTSTMYIIKKEIFLENIHYKYNFRILPGQNNKGIFAIKKGTSIKLIYPEELNLTSDDTFIVRYIMNDPSNSDEVKLNLYSNNDLYCENLIKMKKCFVNRTHFSYQETGLYYAHRAIAYILKDNTPIMAKYSESDPIYIILPPVNKIEINIEECFNNQTIKVGANGTLYFFTSYNDSENIFDIEDILDKTNFNNTIKDESDNEYNVACKLWKILNSNLILLCDLNTILKFEIQKITFNPTYFIYNDIKIVINSLTLFTVEQLKIKIPFLYSDKQIINLEEEVSSYSLLFHIGKYSNEFLFLYDDTKDSKAYQIFDECNIKEKNLICNINKEKIEEIGIYSGQVLNLFYQYNLEDIQKLVFSPEIVISYNYKKKENINVEINKPLMNNIEKNSFIYYETNVNTINNVYSNYFQLNLKNDTNINCFFSKKISSNLLLICKIINQGKYSLEEIKEDILLDNINIKYNFIIKSINNNEEFITSSSKGAYFWFNHPQVLDFTKTNILTIDYFGEYPEYYNKIKLNIDSDYLQCKDGKSIKRCTVLKRYFEKKPSGYYNTYHLNYLNKYSIFYELSPIRIILPIDNEFIIRIKYENNRYSRIVGQKGTISFISDYDDNEYNLFNNSDIEIKTSFKTKISIGYKNKYNVTCRLWKPKNKKIKIFCKLLEDFKDEGNSYIESMDKATFEYKNYNISIVTELYENKIQLIDDSIPFLYSDEQEIIIEENINSYDLRFKIDSYNNELLLLHGPILKEIIFDDCMINEKELLCSITKEKIEEILGYDGEEFSLAFLKDNFGTYDFDSVSKIIFKYEKIEKEDIYINIINLLSIPGSRFIAYGTNVSYIKNITSEEFKLDNIYYSKVSCLFKKNSNDNLLLLCLANYGQRFSLAPTKTEILLSNASIIYNFRIQNIPQTDIVVPKDYLYYKNIYPQILDFTNKESLSFLVFSSALDPINYLRINPDSSNLKCAYNRNYSICTVPLSHFDFVESGYYNLFSFFNSEQALNIYELNQIKVTLPKRNYLIISIKSEDNQETLTVGQLGTFYLITNYFDNETNLFNISDVEKKTKFQTTITDEKKNKYYNINCRLWKASDDEKIIVLCKMDTKFKNINQNIKLDNAIFIYGEYKILLKVETSIKIHQLNYQFPFFYYQKQIIYFKENIELFELKFKFDDFYNNNILLYLYDNQLIYYNILENCNIKEIEKELICKIPKKQIGNFYLSDNDFLKFGIIDDNIGTISYNLIHNIYITYENLQKKDINIEQIKLIKNITEINAPFVYETNIDTIPELITNNFILTFDNKYNITCYFKKSIENLKLLILCKSNIKQEFYLGKSNEKIILDNIHYKYNFIIEPFENYEKIFVDAYGSSIGLIYPNTINIDLEKIGTIRFIMENPSNYKYILLHPNFRSLECKDLIGMKKCNISYKNIPFIENGYYYAQHLNYLNKYSANYESGSINIILSNFTKIRIGIEEKDNQDIIKLGEYGILYLVTNYNDSEYILNFTDITFFLEYYHTTFNNFYEAYCNFWKPKHNNLRILCQMNEYFYPGVHNIYIKETFFIYKTYNISIYSEETNIKINQLDYHASFLFSDEQEIDLNKENNNFIKLNGYFYNNTESFFLYQNNLRYIKLSCNQLENHVICNFKKDELLKILSFDGERYKLAMKSNSEKMNIIPSVLDITIKFQRNEIDVELQIEKLLTPKIKKNEFIAYETNAKNISGFEFTDYFNISTEDNQNLNCLFKNNGIDNLILLCIAENEGDYALGKINLTYINNVNIFYNFIIKESENNETISISHNGTIVTRAYPKEFNFTEKDYYIITYETEFPEKLNNIFLNKDSNTSLECINYLWYKECNITKEHFGKLKTNYFYTYHSIDKNSKAILYEVDPLLIILDNKDENIPEKEEKEEINYSIIIISAIIGGVVLIIILGILIWFFLKKKKNKNLNKVEKREIVYPSSDDPNIEIPIIQDFYPNSDKSGPFKRYYPRDNLIIN